jgi:hypothetical protein
MELDQLERFLERTLGKTLDGVEEFSLSGWRAVQIFWPLNALFTPHIERIKTLKYRAIYEPEADKAIEAFVAKPVAETWATISPGTWRVLLERHQQMLTVALANEAAGNPLTSLPVGLPAPAELQALMLLFLHSMKLPWPPKDRSRLDLPNGPAPASLRPH